MRTVHPQTRENLLRAMRREAYAFAVYLLYATQARKHGRPEIAQLLEQVANEEYFGLMYRDFQAQAETVGDHENADRFRRLREYERRNRDQFLAVRRNLDPVDPAG
jgi:rubrerythrin